METTFKLFVPRVHLAFRRWCLNLTMLWLTLAAMSVESLAVVVPPSELGPKPATGGSAAGKGPACWNISTLDPNPAIWYNECPWLDTALANANYTAANGWHFRYKNPNTSEDFALESKFALDEYYAWVVNDPSGRFTNWDAGGARIRLEYSPTGSDPVDIHWVQAYRQRLGCDGEYTMHLDGPNYAPGAVPWYDVGGMAGDTWFRDTPYDSCKTCCKYCTDVEFQVFLAVDNIASGKHYVDLYEGIWWGYEYTCVPEPATVLLLGFGGLVLVRRRRTLR